MVEGKFYSDPFRSFKMIRVFQKKEDIDNIKMPQDLPMQESLACHVR